jgi:tRNA (guanine37-N1)-methyltransferase
MRLTFDSKLKGMKTLDKKMFDMQVTVPCIRVKKSDYNSIKRSLRSMTLESLQNIKKFSELNEADDPQAKTHKLLILDPDLFIYEKLDQNVREELYEFLKKDKNLTDNSELEKCIEKIQISIGYDDLKFDDVMKAVIPEELQAENVNVKGYSIIGHIAHFNLRDQVLDYKNIIGQVLIDKICHIKTVVNKLNEIDNTYRNFSFEILAGENDTFVSCKENACEFRFDFSKVYWNPRLGTEHERVVKLLNPNDVVYDVFAGVGPFSVPAATARKCSYVISNDLNPESYRYLADNYKINSKSKTKIKELESRRSHIKLNFKNPDFVLSSDQSEFKFNPLEFFTAFNLDGREFITKKLKFHLIEVLNYRFFNKIDNAEFDKSKFYALMNLPALSVEFLDAFYQLYDESESKIIRDKLDENLLNSFSLNIFCYHFVKGDETEYEKIKHIIRNDIFNDSDLAIQSKYVRKVAPNKDMFCTMFELKFNKHLLTNYSKKRQDNDETEGDIPSKMQKV